MARTSSEDTNKKEERTVAIRVPPAFKDELDSVIKLTGKTLNEAGTEALQDWVAKILADENVQSQAMADLAEQERALQERREALQKLIGNGGTEATDNARKSK